MNTAPVLLVGTVCTLPGCGHQLEAQHGRVWCSGCNHPYDYTPKPLSNACRTCRHPLTTADGCAACGPYKAPPRAA